MEQFLAKAPNLKIYYNNSWIPINNEIKYLTAPYFKLTKLSSVFGGMTNLIEVLKQHGSTLKELCISDYINIDLSKNR